MAEQETIVREVEAAYRNYVDLFNRRDASEIAGLYDRPHAQLIDGIGLSVVRDDVEQQQWFDMAVAHLEGQGWARTEIDRLQVWPVSSTVAQLVATVTRFRTDGSVLQQLRANYTVRRIDGHWRVVLSIPLADDDFEAIDPS